MTPDTMDPQTQALTAATPINTPRPAGSPPAALVLVSCADAGEIGAWALDAPSGRLRLQQTVAAGGQLMPMALSPDRRRLYVARRSAPMTVLSLAIGADGRLQPLGEAPLPASMAYIVCDATGRWLLSASYGEHLVAVSPIGPDGVVGAAHQVLPVGRHAHSIAIDPTNRCAHVACLGDDAVWRLAFDPDTGRLQPDEPPTQAMRPGCGPRHLVIAAQGRRLYLLNELDATLEVFDREPGSGAVHLRQTAAMLSAAFDGKPWAAELAARQHHEPVVGGRHPWRVDAGRPGRGRGPAARDAVGTGRGLRPGGGAGLAPPGQLAPGPRARHAQPVRPGRHRGQPELDRDTRGRRVVNTATPSVQRSFSVPRLSFVPCQV